MGRATKLTPEVQDKVCQAVASGMHLHRAAKLAGIGERTFYRWMEKGDPDAIGEPDLENMPIKTLRGIATAATITLPKRATREQIIALLNDAGEGSWETYRQFRQAVEEAELQCEQTLVAQWRVLAPDNYNAIKEFMTRRFKHWSPTQQVEVSGPEGTPIPIEVRAKAIAASAAAFRATQEGTD